MRFSFVTYVRTDPTRVLPAAPEGMNLNVVVLLLAIQGLAHSFRKGQGDDLFGDEGPWKEDDWGENSASSTAEYDDFTGFDSGSSAKGQRNDDEKPRTLPRIPRTFTNRRFVTSGDGEDKGGSKEGGGSDSKFHGSNDQGSANNSSIDLTKIADALDIMKKLKKAKSDHELVNKLKSGPESLGVAFKTFEQLSGLWISVMHRIWRVWKAKGARVVMHSIVDDLMNNTGRAITQKVGDFFSKDNAVKPADGSGSATTIDAEGSWEPETSHRSDVIQNKTVENITAEKVSVDFTKNATKAAKAQPEKTQSSAKNVTDIVEKVKVSFNDKYVNESISTQTTKQASRERKNYTQTTLDGMNKNLTVKSQKNVNSGNSTVSTLKSATSLSKESEYPPKNIEIGNASFFNSGKKAKRLFNNERTLQVTRNFEENQHVTQHFTTNHVKKEQGNVTQVLNHNQTKGSREINSNFKSQQTNTKVQDASMETQSSSVILKVNTGSHHGNGNYLPSNKDVQLEKVVIIKEPNKANNTNQNQTKGTQEFNSGLMSHETNTKVQNALSERHSSSIRLKVNSGSHHGNGNHLSSNKDVHFQKVVIIKEPNKANNTNQNQTKGTQEFNSGLMSHETNTKVQNALSETHSSSTRLKVNSGSHHGNGNHLSSNKDVHFQKVVIIKEPNKANNTNQNQTKGTQEFNSDLMSHETNTKVQNASSETHSSSTRLKVNSGSHHGNGNHLSSNKDVHLQKVVIIKEPNRTNNTNHNQTKRGRVFTDDVMSHETNTKVKNASSETHFSSITLKVNTGSHHGKGKYLPSNKDVHLQKVVIIKEPNKANNTNQNQTKSTQEFNSDLMSHETNTKVQNASSETHSSSITLNVNTGSHHGNGNHLPSKKDVHLQKVVIIKEPNRTNNTNHNQTKGVRQFNGDLKSQVTNTKAQNASSETHTSSIRLKVNSGSHHGNGQYLPSNKDVHLAKVTIIKEPNKDNNMNHHQTKGGREFNSDLMSHETNTKVQNASTETHSSSIRLKVNTGSHHGNGNHLPSNKDVLLEKVVIIKEPNKDNNTAEKVKERENVKINFLEKSKRSHVEKKYYHVSQVDDLKSQSKSPLQIKSEAKTDSKDTPMALSKPDQLALSADKRMRDINTARNSSKAKHDSYDKDEKQRFSNRRPDNSSMISSITSPNSEKIVVHLNGKQESSKDNETDSFVELKINGVDGNGGSRDNGSNDLSENNKFSEEKHGSKENDLNLPPRGTDKTEKVGFEKTKIPQDGGYETQNDDENSKKVVDKDRVKNELQAKQIERVFNNSGSDVAVISKVQKKLHARVEGSTHKLAQDYHQESDTVSVREQMAMHTRKSMEIKYAPKGTGESHEESQKEKPERKVREGESRSAFLASSNNVKEARKTISHNSSLDTSASTSKTTSGLDFRTTRDPPKIALHISGKKQTNSLVESENVARKERPKRPNIVRAIVAKGVVDVERHGQEIDVANSPVGSGQLQATDSDLKHKVESDTSLALASESGSGHLLLEGGVTRDPKRHTEYDEKSVMTSDSKHDLESKQKGERINESDNSLTRNRKGQEVKSHQKTGLAQKAKGVVVVGRQDVVKHSSNRILDNSSNLKISKVTHQRSKQDHGSDRLKRKFSSQKLAKTPGQANLAEAKYYSIARTTEENSENGNIDEARIKAQSASPGTDEKPNNLTNEDKEPIQVQHVDVLTSRTPPTSLLTTSNDDNAYSIKEIVQGPRGSRLVHYENPDERKITSLKKKVVKLENEVTVLETAMADLAKRLLAVEQKSEHPFPTMPTLLHPPKTVTAHNQDAIPNQQQTTVYVGKDVTSTPQIPAPRYGPEKIVIPISSLYPGTEHVSTHPASIHEAHDDQEPQDNSRSDDKSRDTTHVTLPLGPQSGPTSEAHAEVRPIVNIIVPNRREDLPPTEAACIPRCQNGGLCLDGNSCRCPTFFTGSYCERFSLRDLLESPKPRERPFRKVQRVLLSELQDRQEMDGTARLDTRAPALEYRGFNLNQDIEPDKGFVVKQQPIEVTSPSSSVNTEGIARRRQLILEI